MHGKIDSLIPPLGVVLLILFISPVCIAQETAQTLYEDALLYREFHLTAIEAYSHYYDSLSTEGDQRQHRYALYYHGRALAESGDWQGASERFKQFAKLKSVDQVDRAIAEIQIALSLHGQGDKKGAKKIWQKYRSSTDPRIMSELGAAFARANVNLPEAKKLCEALTETDQGKQQNLLWIYRRSGNLKKAKLLLDQIDPKLPSLTIKDPKNVPYDFFDPVIFGHLSWLNLSLAAAKTPTTQNAYFVGKALYELGEQDKAIEAFELMPDRSEAQARLKVIGNSIKRKRISFEPIWIGACQFRLNRKTEALETWKAAISQFANNPDFWSEFGLAYDTLTFDQESAEALRQITQITQTHQDKIPMAFCQKAIALRGYDNKRRSVKKFDRQYFINLAVLYKRNGDLKRAQETFERCKGRAENPPMLVAQISQCYLAELFDSGRTHNLVELVSPWYTVIKEYPAAKPIYTTLALTKYQKDPHERGHGIR